ncbi:hypothetical protein [Streptomyces sp. NBC_00887]|uniref:hypothetical protein n=1 Tax=Streptomyces sp. NBC_00887 TaxID=2975859 RepID=UPI00386EB580|nr:hypothetical protein OG844_00500 [Streptomyces sp. NBC_00887]WSY36322.1 hypothetical protein OG844_45095 [Streptomyces sp. NBC_00887]
MSSTAPIPEQLTPAQADDRACLVCGSEAAVMRPVGDRAGVQLFACVPCIDRARTPHDSRRPTAVGTVHSDS